MTAEQHRAGRPVPNRRAPASGMRVKTIIFDLDGTLVDSAADLQAAANRMLADLGAPPVERETVIGFIGAGVETLVKRVLAHRDIAVTAETFEAQLAAYRAHYARDLTTLTRPYPGVLRLLDHLSGLGMTLGICTNKPEAPARAIAEAVGLSPYLSAIVGGDTTPAKKPDPAPLLLAVDRLGGTPQDTLFVGDSAIDYATAGAAGIRFAYFEGGYQRAPIADFRPDHRVGSMPDILDIVKSYQ